LLIKYTKNLLWRVAKRLSYIEDARCTKVNAVRKEELFPVKIHSKYVNALCRQNLEFFIIEPGGAQGNHGALQD